PTELELSEAEQDTGTQALEAGRLAVLEGRLQMLLAAAEVALLHQHQAEVVLGPRKLAPVTLHRVESQRPLRAVGGLAQVAGLLVGKAHSGVHPGHPVKVLQRTRDLDRLIEETDRLGPFLAQHAEVSKVAEDPHQQRDRHWLQLATQAKSLLPEVDRARVLEQVKGPGLGVKRFDVAV